MLCRRYCSIIFVAVGLTACSAPPPPAADTLKNQLAIDLPSYWRAASFAVNAEQAPERRTDPYRARFRAEVELVSPTYVEEQRFGDTVIARMTGKAGDRRTLFGRVESRLKSGRWASTLRLENNPVEQGGRPRDFIQARRIIIAGSAEEQRFWAERRRIEEERTASARQVEQEMARGMFVDALTGEWQGEVFRERDSRLYITGTADALTATLFHEGYREDLSVQILDGRSVMLTGYSVIRQDGRAATRYQLDTFSLELSADGRMLFGSAWDAGAQSGSVRLTKVGE